MKKEKNLTDTYFLTEIPNSVRAPPSQLYCLCNWCHSPTINWFKHVFIKHQLRALQSGLKLLSPLWIISLHPCISPQSPVEFLSKMLLTYLFFLSVLHYCLPCLIHHHSPYPQLTPHNLLAQFCGGELWRSLGFLSEGLKSQNYFHNNTEMLLAPFHCVDICTNNTKATVVKLLVP